MQFHFYYVLFGTSAPILLVFCQYFVNILQQFSRSPAVVAQKDVALVNLPA